MLESSDPEPLFVLTLDFLKAQVAARLEDRRAEEEARKRGEEKDRLLEAARVMIGDEKWASLAIDGLAEISFASSASVNETPQVMRSFASKKSSGSSSPSPPKISRSAWVNLELAKEDSGLSLAQLVERAKAKPFDSGFGDVQEYENWIISAAQRGRVRRRAGLFFSEEALLRNRPKAPYTSSGRINWNEVILTVIRELGGSGRSKEIVKAFWETPLAASNLTPGSQYPYTLLSRMAECGVLTRVGSTYTISHPDPTASEELSSQVAQNHQHFKEERSEAA